MPLRIRVICSNQVLFAVILLLTLTVGSVHGAIVIQPSNTVVYQGDTAYLYCQFSVPPKSGTSCFWTRSGTNIAMAEFSGIYDWIGDYQKGNCSFRITGAEVTRDDAQWVCELPATSDDMDGEKSATAKLSVYKTPTAPTIEYHDTNISTNKNLSVSENQTEDFICESHSGNPVPQLSWTMDNVNIKASHEKTEIEENNKTYKRTSEFDITFTKNDNGKVLRCIMNHVTMNSTSLFVDLKIDVQYMTTRVETMSPSYVVVDEGSGYQFTCVADGNPPAKCEWLYKRGDAENWEIKSDFCIYEIESATYNNEGEYMCLAGNKGMLPSQVITFQLRSTTRNVVAIIGGVFGALLVVAIIILAVVVWRLRKKLMAEAAEGLPDFETLNRATSEMGPKKREYNTRDTYMIPVPTERAPLNPPTYSPTPFNPFIHPRPFELRPKSGSWRRDPDSHIYAEPHFYETVDGPSTAKSDDLNDEPTYGPPKLPSTPPKLPSTPPKLPSTPPSPSDTTPDDGTYLAVSYEDDTNNRESTA